MGRQSTEARVLKGLRSGAEAWRSRSMGHRSIEEVDNTPGNDITPGADTRKRSPGNQHKKTLSRCQHNKPPSGYQQRGET